MKQPRVRFTVRWLVIAVALAGLSAGLFAMRQRAARRRERAAFHAVRKEELARVVADWKKGNVRLINMTREAAESESARMTRLIPFHDAMGRKWEEAASRPWLSVVPDPPEPK